MGLPPARVTDIVQGKRKVQVAEATIIARFLEMPLIDVISRLVGDTVAESQWDSPLKRVRVVGFVQAGVWTDMVLADDDLHYDIAIKPPPGTEHAKLKGLEVRGPSMNLVYPEGTIVVCMDIVDYLETRRPDLPDGAHVVVHRISPSNDVEATVKTVRRRGSDVWLIPESTDPTFNAIRLENEGDETTIHIRAVVVGSFAPAPVF